MNTCADELLMSSRLFNPSVLLLKEADVQRPLLVVGVEGILGIHQSTPFFTRKNDEAFMMSAIVDIIRPEITLFFKIKSLQLRLPVVLLLSGQSASAARGPHTSATPF